MLTLAIIKDQTWVFYTTKINSFQKCKWTLKTKPDLNCNKLMCTKITLFPHFVPMMRNVNSLLFLRNCTVNAVSLYVAISTCTLYIVYIYIVQLKSFKNLGVFLSLAIFSLSRELQVSNTHIGQTMQNLLFLTRVKMSLGSSYAQTTQPMFWAFLF